MAVAQHALTVVAELRPGITADAARRAIKALERDVIHALEPTQTLHFGRFVVLTTPAESPPRLALETNHDGDLQAHLDELMVALAPFEDRLFGMWAGYEPGQLARFVARHKRPASTFYLGHPGLSVRQIRNDDAVRATLMHLLDEAQRAGELEGKSATAVRDLLLARLAKAPVSTAPYDRELPLQPESTILFYAIVVGLVLIAPPFLLAARFVEKREQRTEARAELVGEADPRLDAIIAHEDSVAQNGLTHHVPLRPGGLRRTVMKMVLWFLEQARKNIAYKGTLGGISSIHFARWVMLEDDTVLFFSNYDGSWEAYLGDFVDKAHHYLTAVWTNTKWFPETEWLIRKGAARESTFKQWTRTFQVENQIWYSAYPHLTVQDVLANVQVREGASGTLNEEEARAWLARL